VEPEYCRVQVVRQMTMIKALMLTKHYALTKVIALFITQVQNTTEVLKH